MLFASGLILVFFKEKALAFDLLALFANDLW